ncbi:MAG: hypothetical protein Q8Q06_02580 [bacterium]|nr:hypothetical protein [bacterium]
MEIIGVVSLLPLVLAVLYCDKAHRRDRRVIETVAVTKNNAPA